jgi:hypothetical protein
VSCACIETVQTRFGGYVLLRAFACPNSVLRRPSMASGQRADSARARAYCIRRKLLIFSTTSSALLVIITTENIDITLNTISILSRCSAASRLSHNPRGRLLNHPDPSASCNSARICPQNLNILLSSRNVVSTSRSAYYRTSWMSYRSCTHSGCALRSPLRRGQTSSLSRELTKRK